MPATKPNTIEGVVRRIIRNYKFILPHFINGYVMVNATEGVRVWFRFLSVTFIFKVY